MAESEGTRPREGMGVGSPFGSCESSRDTHNWTGEWAAWTEVTPGPPRLVEWNRSLLNYADVLMSDGTKKQVSDHSSPSTDTTSCTRT